MEIITFKNYYLIRKGAMCMFEGVVKMCEFCEYAFSHGYKCNYSLV